MLKSTKLKESLSPLKPLLDFQFTQFFIVNGNKLAYKF